MLARSDENQTSSVFSHGSRTFVLRRRLQQQQRECGKERASNLFSRANTPHGCQFPDQRYWSHGW